MNDKVFNNIKRNIRCSMSYISPVITTKIIYRKRMKKKLNLKNPITFNEKLQWLKFYGNRDLMKKCADKYEMREYVNECKCENILNDLYGVYNDVEEINFELLPEKFVIKCTHGCGYNIICKNKKSLNVENVKKTLSKWMNQRFGYESAEIQYFNMKPRIIVEKYLENEGIDSLIDYKIYCFNGEPIYILACLDRESDIKKIFYDLEWNKMELRKDSCELEVDKPSCFNEMLEYSRKLAKPFPFVRVDFYDINNKPILGELTFTPAACLSKEYTEKAELELGELIKLPKLKM